MSQDVVDSSVTEELWDAAIPVQVVLDSSEVTALPAPGAYYVLVPRVSYLHRAIDEIRAHFEAALPPGEDQPWFDYRGLPLKWGIPVGVLHDLLAAAPCERPWRLTVHFRSYPAMLLPFEGGEALQASYFNSLKEAVYILQNTAGPVMGLSEASRAALWRGLGEGRAREFLDAAGPLFRAGAVLKRVPVRVYLRGAGEGGGLSWEQVEVSSRAVGLAAGEGGSHGGEHTLGTAIAALVPAIGPELEGLEGAAGPAGGAGGVAVTVAGVAPPLGAPLRLLYERLSGPDHFLHVTVVARKRLELL